MVVLDRVMGTLGALAFLAMGVSALLQWREDRHRPTPRMRFWRVRPGGALTMGVLAVLIACWWTLRALTAG
jgi:hypothetical protein